MKISQLSQTDVEIASRNSWRSKSFFGPLYMGHPIVIERERRPNKEGKTCWVVKWTNSVIDNEFILQYDPQASERTSEHLTKTRIESLQEAFDRADRFMDVIVHETVRDARVLAGKLIPQDAFGLSSSFNDDGQHIITVYVKIQDALLVENLKSVLNILPAKIIVRTVDEDEDEENKESNR